MSLGLGGSGGFSRSGADRWAAASGLGPKTPILEAASAGQTSGWLPVAPFPERLFYQLDSGSVSTQFSIDISEDGLTALGQAFTGSWASSAAGEFTPPLAFTNPRARFFRMTVISGGPFSAYRNA